MDKDDKIQYYQYNQESIIYGEEYPKNLVSLTVWSLLEGKNIILGECDIKTLHNMISFIIQNVKKILKYLLIFFATGFASLVSSMFFLGLIARPILHKLPDRTQLLIFCLGAWLVFLFLNSKVMIHEAQVDVREERFSIKRMAILFGIMMLLLALPIWNRWDYQQLFSFPVAFYMSQIWLMYFTNNLLASYFLVFSINIVWLLLMYHRGKKIFNMRFPHFYEKQQEIKSSKAESAAN